MTELLISIALLHLVAVASPGPDFFFVSRLSAKFSRRTAFFGALGITLGVAIWLAACAAGLSLLFKAFPILAAAAAFIGGSYLLYVGFLLGRSAIASFKGGSGAGAQHDVEEMTACSAFVKGLLTNLSNAKAFIYFTAVLSKVIAEASTLALGVISALITIETLCWFSLVVVFFSAPAVKRGYLRASKYIDLASGLVFAAFGAALVIDAAEKLF